MKKLLILGMMVLFLSSLIAVESEPSDVVGFVKYELVVGNNFVATPMDDGDTSSSQIGDKIAGADQISYFDATTQAWVSSPKNMFGNWVSSFAITGGMPLMVRTTMSSDFYSKGAMYEPAPNYDLVVGTNAIMIPLAEITLTTSALVGDDIGTVDQLSYFDSSTQSWVSSPKNMFGNWVSPFATETGMPLLVRAITSSSWPIARSIDNNMKIIKYNKK